ncbi:F-box protein CPR1-like [Cornus florida]|uniref:F-box protein CPR1-like n=1 Tax=Cornus florida TaxID=4283 RepID=UPI0028A23C82|nr:F-box protein CPR1-like [Cornus florida]
MEMIERREESSSIKSLPNDVVMDILSRLPVKSLVRFKCVSKSWLTLFTDPYFVKMHLNRSYEPNKKQLVFSCHIKEWRSAIVVFSGNIIEPSGKVDYPLNFECQSGKFLGCCDGLILYSTSPYSSCEEELHLLNPSTRKVKRLHPPFKSITGGVSYGFGGAYGFGYDALTDDYKVVHIPYCHKSITTLYTRKTNSWRRIQDIPYHVMCSAPAAALLNGALHWLTKDMSKIVSLNLEEEKFQVFILPAEFETQQREAYLVTVLRGCLCVCVKIMGKSGWRSCEFWVMKEYEKKENTHRYLEIPGDSQLGSLRRYDQDNDGDSFMLEVEDAEIFLESIVSPLFSYLVMQYILVLRDQIQLLVSANPNRKHGLDACFGEPKLRAVLVISRNCRLSSPIVVVHCRRGSPSLFIIVAFVVCRRHRCVRCLWILNHQLRPNPTGLYRVQP